MKKPLLEICAGSIVSAFAAQAGGADRIELCANLGVGGTTPSPGMIIIVKEKLTIPVFVLLRPREGDFLYTDEEFATMKEDLLFCKEAGVNGFVFGLLDAEGRVDEARNRELLALADPLPCTFHRAFDLCADPRSALESIIRCGFTRLLSSGQAATALQGAALLHELLKQANGRISIMPGAGIHADTIEALVAQTGAAEFHASLKKPVSSAMQFRHPGAGSTPTGDEYQWMETHAEDVALLKEKINRHFQVA